ncbi:19645_t:CDS:2 [Entrophospora sp. SA101]|nr:19645_t:CDS:2 [Entrophospora sp. SA101]CAJ0827870.1 9260_t:CDS:2 [Entrophospora sp. SA101]
MGANHAKHRPQPDVNKTCTEKFRFIEGRRYHNQKTLYDLPNDNDEIDRLNLEHFLVRAVYQSNYSSPINDLLTSGISVLDVGCGSGAWALEMATNYHKSEFVGIDVSPTFPVSIKPQNITFLEKNILESIPYDDESFDFVHMRFMLPAFSQKQWEEIVINEVIRVVKGGGWLELCEYELCQNCGPVLEHLLNRRKDMFNEMGINPLIAQLLGKFMERSEHFEEVYHEKKTIPIGEWGGRIGQVGKEDIVTRMTAIGPALFNYMKITSKEYEDMMKQSIEEFNEYETFFVTCRLLKIFQSFVHYYANEL